MRRPRIEDYDPNAKLPELASPIDGMPVIGKPPQKSKDLSPSLQVKPVAQKEQAKKVRQNGTLSPVQLPQANKRPVMNARACLQRDEGRLYCDPRVGVEVRGYGKRRLDRPAVVPIGIAVAPADPKDWTAQQRPSHHY
jgi:hypothetical protein